MNADELIYFSSTLASDLAAHAQQLRDAWATEFGRKQLPEVTRVDVAAARQNGLMPDDGKSANWLAGLDRQVVSDLRR